jgi:hypothetical protein
LRALAAAARTELSARASVRVRHATREHAGEDPSVGLPVRSLTP